MKNEEKSALEYFQSKGFTNIIFEPDGNIPPDFLINNEIAVEVRRLNQYMYFGGNSNPLEKLGYKLIPRIVNCINSFRDTASSKTAFVSIGFSRPLKINKQLMDDVQRVLLFHLNHLDENITLIINNKLSLRFHIAQKAYGYPYVLGSISDGDSGGLVVGNTLDSLKIVIPEKEKKIAPYKDKYQIWWLAVINMVDLTMNEMDLNQLKESFKIETSFKRVIFISPFDSSKGLELET